jgi:hypothetical protein
MSVPFQTSQSRELKRRCVDFGLRTQTAKVMKTSPVDETNGAMDLPDSKDHFSEIPL